MRVMQTTRRIERVRHASAADQARGEYGSADRHPGAEQHACVSRRLPAVDQAGAARIEVAQEREVLSRVHGRELVLAGLGRGERRESLPEEPGVVECPQRERVPRPRRAAGNESATEITIVPRESDGAAHHLAGYRATMCYPPGARPPAIPGDFLPPMSGGAGGEEAILTSADGTNFRAYLARAAGDAAAVIAPDVLGLHPFYEELAERFATAGIHALAVDHLGRHAGGGGPPPHPSLHSPRCPTRPPDHLSV